ncbi:MAG: GlsB/YeaQ/YmgE family stress response membrane protein [Acidobacteria bacterium]|nr:GlsB/YeaQ/YmgE family stress response membrane protein [Acidobacteriota bacterium]
MGCFQVLWSLLIGFLVGLVARALVPGIDSMGLILTTVLGVVGSLVGGFLGGLVSKPKEGAKFNPAGFLLSVVGAIVVLVLWRLVR